MRHTSCESSHRSLVLGQYVACIPSTSAVNMLRRCFSNVQADRSIHITSIALVFIVKRIFERTLQPFFGNLLYQLLIFRDMVCQHIRQQYRRRNVRREVLQGSDQRSEFLLHPHVDIDRRILLDLSQLEKAFGIFILGIFTPLPTSGSSSGIGKLRRGRLSIILNFICIHNIRFLSL